MDPRSFFRELLEEGGGSAGATPASASVLQIGNLRAHHFQIFVADRQTPHLFSGCFSRRFEAIVDAVVAGENSGIRVSESNDDRAGERSRVDQVGAAELASVAEAVGKHEAAFGVGVDDLDGFSRHRSLNITWFLSFPR